jgi:hypothetical protein
MKLLSNLIKRLDAVYLYLSRKYCPAILTVQLQQLTEIGKLCFEQRFYFGQDHSSSVQPRPSLSVKYSAACTN